MASGRTEYNRDYLFRLSSVRRYRIPAALSAHLRQLNILKFVSGSVKKKQESSVEFCHLNICGIIGDSKFDYVQQLLSSKPNIILALTESHLYHLYPEQLLQVSGYQCHRRDRLGKRGGGVLLYVPDYIRSTEVERNQSIDHETLWVRCGIGPKTVLVSCIFRPPDTSNQKTRQLLSYAESIVLRYPGIDHVLMGDLNIDVSQTSKNQLKPELIAFCSANNLSIKINDFSRVAQRKWQDGTTSITKTIIDLILCSLAGNYSIEPPNDTSISDHRLIKTISRYRCPIPTHKVITVTNWRRGNQQQLLADVRHLTRRYVSFQPYHDPQRALSTLVHDLFTVIDRNYPKRTIRVSRKDAPWINSHIKALTGRRDLAYKQWKTATSNSQEKQAAFNQLKRDVIKAIATSKNSWFVNNSNNAKKIWDNLNRLANRNTPVAPSTTLNVNELNGHFVRMGQHGTTHEVMTLPSGSDDEQPVAAPKFQFETIQPPVVFDILSEMSSKRKASGPWGIPHQLLRLLTPYITEPLTHLINQCLQRGEYPDIFKIAAVTPIPKQAAASHPDHFRPISLIANLSKLFEKIVQKQLVKYLKTNDILSSRQSGFRDGHSCETLLVKVTEEWKRAMDKSKVIAAAFLDFKKAFDSVCHNKLLAVLHEIGINGANLKWFFSYLKDRAQYVEFDGKRSEQQSISSGVPQGTVLGPTLFTLYINGMLRRSESRPNAAVECFADDAMIFTRGTTVAEAVTELNIALSETADWIAQSDLVLNEKKCVHMIISSAHKKNDNGASSSKVLMGTHELEKKQSVRYLGVHVDQHLKWSQHFQHVKSKINNGTAIINRAKSGLPNENRIALYRAFVEPYVDLCAPVWSSAADKYINIVEVAQRKALRAMADYDQTKTTDELFEEWGIEKVTERWKRLDAQWLYKLRHPIKYPTVPEYIRALVPFRKNEREARTKSKTSDIIPPACKTKIGERMFCRRLWQLDLSLPNDIWGSTSLASFRRAFNLAIRS